MFVDLLLVLLAMLVPTVMSVMGIPQEVTAPVLAAALLFWPGYAATLVIWPRSQGSDTPLKLAISPFLSIIIVLGVSLVYWFGHLSATPESISIYTFILVVILLDIVALTRFLSNRRGRIIQTVRPARMEISSALGIFVTMGIVFSLAAAGPQKQAEARPLVVAIYLNPEETSYFRSASDAMIVPVVLKNSSEDRAITVTLSGSIKGKTVMSQQIELTAGETMKTEVMIPRSVLSTSEASPVDIEAKSPGNKPVLRAWLRAVKARHTGGEE